MTSMTCSNGGTLGNLPGWGVHVDIDFWKSLYSASFNERLHGFWVLSLKFLVSAEKDICLPYLQSYPSSSRSPPHFPVYLVFSQFWILKNILIIFSLISFLRFHGYFLVFTELVGACNNNCYHN